MHMGNVHIEISVVFHTLCLNADGERVYDGRHGSIGDTRGNPGNLYPQSKGVDVYCICDFREISLFWHGSYIDHI